MADLIIKAAVRDAVDGNVSGDFYDALDEAARRADENTRKTVQARDL